MLNALLVVALTAAAAPAPRPKNDVPYEVVKLPMQRAKPGTAHVRATSKWYELWTADAVAGCGHPNPIPAPPEIDFEKWEIVALFLGPGDSARKDPQVVSVKDRGDEVLISYRDNTPSANERPPKGVSRGVVVCRQMVVKVKYTGKRVRLARVP